MSWPLASHFSALLQTPAVAFRDPVLKRCHIEKDGRNQPRPWSGAFAVVYKGIHADGGGAFAVRVFTTESPERRERYDRISEYFKARPPALPSSLRVSRPEYPLGRRRQVVSAGPDGLGRGRNALQVGPRPRIGGATVRPWRRLPATGPRSSRNWPTPRSPTATCSTPT